MHKAVRIYHFHVVERCNMCAKSAADAIPIGLRLNKSQGLSPRKKTGIAVTVCRCWNCGLHFPQPMPVPETLSDHYGIPPEKYWRPEYFQIEPKYFLRQIEDAKRLLSFQSGMKALDIGTGIGKAVIAMKSAGFDAWGIEPSEPFYVKALEFTGFPADRLQNSAIEDANFPERFFDFISFGAVLEHLYDPSGSIEKAVRWLKPNGVIHIEVPSSKHMISKLLNAYFRLIGTNYVTNISPMHPPFHIYEFTLKSFSEHSKRAGYQVDYHYINVATVRHVPHILRPAFAKWMEIQGTGQQLTVWLRKRSDI